LLDVDHFKQFNDEFGHSAGDDCLKQVATTLSRCRRMSDFPARVGGEEFALLLPETDSKGALAVAETVRQQVEAAGILHPRSPHAVVTASIGVAAFQPQPNRTASDVVRASDQAMYVAKRAGRNRVVSATNDTGADLCQGND
jgi:diguanylate cyclase (GGDEF)-like protein